MEKNKKEKKCQNEEVEDVIHVAIVGMIKFCILENELENEINVDNYHFLKMQKKQDLKALMVKAEHENPYIGSEDIHPQEITRFPKKK